MESFDYKLNNYMVFLNKLVYMCEREMVWFIDYN